MSVITSGKTILTKKDLLELCGAYGQSESSGEIVVKNMKYIHTAKEVISQYPSLDSDKLKSSALEQIKLDPHFAGRAYAVAHNVCTMMQNLINKRESEEYVHQQYDLAKCGSDRRHVSGKDPLPRNIFRTG